MGDSGGWNTIESDAGVFTFLLDNLGATGIQCAELISLDSELLCQLSPVYGVIFLFKYPTKKDERPKDGELDHEAARDVWFALQTIQNACGTQALLSILLNIGEEEKAIAMSLGSEIQLGDELQNLKEFTLPLPAEYRGSSLSNSERIRAVHNSFAKASPFSIEQTRPAGEDQDVYHFIAYMPINGALYELDGLQYAPINHGACSFEEFPEKVIPVLQRRVERYPQTEIRFNLLAVCGDLRNKAKTIGDDMMLLREEEKRAEWQFENALRRHNFIGFGAEVLKEVVRQKLKCGEYDKWIDESRAKTKQRMGDGKKRKGREMDIEDLKDME